ncbi:hypothetical protein BCR37DRAFT_384083 [Protomyces lactucae-debilis]|uniref:Secreted protein n=1 Tax=Protomyces lactucae-debilis TaxID=2754530 RepID=A0A1Y2EV27_PROLT|nr:uncharacterized protein BCR37DRAFT_384083 [Protomyces lactucae-debilis]ORY75461.1 hypothetical protein BCR37DRAFT_384083 [Protomyces lactucae-debilis]
MGFRSTFGLTSLSFLNTGIAFRPPASLSAGVSPTRGTRIGTAAGFESVTFFLNDGKGPETLRGPGRTSMGGKLEGLGPDVGFTLSIVFTGA